MRNFLQLFLMFSLFVQTVSAEVPEASIYDSLHEIHNYHDYICYRQDDLSKFKSEEELYARPLRKDIDFVRVKQDSLFLWESDWKKSFFIDFYGPDRSTFSVYSSYRHYLFDFRIYLGSEREIKESRTQKIWERTLDENYLSQKFNNGHFEMKIKRKAHWHRGSHLNDSIPYACFTWKD